MSSSPEKSASPSPPDADRSAPAAVSVPAPERPARPVRHLYVHVPFCASKCGYCAFYSEAASAELKDRYVRALLRELELVADDLAPETIYFGGGTPTLLSPRQWETILAAFHRRGWGRPAEWTVEGNPATLSPDKARLLREHGVNRFSLGIQSLDAGLLERLGRVHTREQAFRSFDLLRRAGFDNLNVDLMFAIPGQTMALWRRTLTEALALQSEHLSCYEVIYEEDTPLFAQLRAGECDRDEDLAGAMYDVLVETVRARGFRRYEVANFARHAGPAAAELPDRACRHNVAYWRGREFYGLGPSASSLIGGARPRNWADTRRYCALLERGRRPVESRDRLSPLARAAELAAFGLRMDAGWPFAEFQAATGFDLRDEWADDLRWLVEQGWGEWRPDRFRLTERGLRFADLAAERLLRPDPPAAG